MAKEKHEWVKLTQEDRLAPKLQSEAGRSGQQGTIYGPSNQVLSQVKMETAADMTPQKRDLFQKRGAGK